MSKLHRFFLMCSFAAATVAGNCALAQNRASPAGDEAAVRQAGKNYLAALQRGDAKAIAEFWTDAGLITDETGRTQNAKDSLKSTAAGQTARPYIKVADATVRFITPDTALEEGQCETTPSGAASPLHGRYTALWVRKDGKWKLDRLHESRAEPPASKTSPLAPLEALVGEWSGKSDKLSIQVSARWNPTKTFVRRETTISADGKPVHSGVQVMGWDPVAKNIRSWQFNSDGGYGEGVWDLDGNSWVMLSSGVLPDGKGWSSAQSIKFRDKDTLVWTLIDGNVAGQPLSHFDITLTRGK